MYGMYHKRDSEKRMCGSRLMFKVIKMLAKKANSLLRLRKSSKTLVIGFEKRTVDNYVSFKRPNSLALEC